MTRIALAASLVIGVFLTLISDGIAVEPVPGTTHFEKWPDELIDAVESRNEKTLQTWSDSRTPVLAVYGAYGLALVDDSAPLCQLVESTSMIPLPAGNEIPAGVLALKLLEDLGDAGVPCLKANLTSDVPEELALKAVDTLRRVGTEAARDALATVPESSPIKSDALRAQLILDKRLRLELSAEVNGDKVSVTLSNNDKRPLRLIGSVSVVQSGRLGTEAAGNGCDAEELASLESDEGVFLAPGEVLTGQCLLPGATRALPVVEVVFRSSARSGQTEPTLWNDGRMLVVADP